MNEEMQANSPKHKFTQESLLTTEEVAEWLSVSPGWVRDHATRKQPRLPSLKLGKLLRFRTEDVKEFIQRWCL
jgi:excisionase family DNA binding protein